MGKIHIPALAFRKRKDTIKETWSRHATLCEVFWSSSIVVTFFWYEQQQGKQQVFFCQQPKENIIGVGGGGGDNNDSNKRRRSSGSNWNSSSNTTMKFVLRRTLLLLVIGLSALSVANIVIKHSMQLNASTNIHCDSHDKACDNDAILPQQAHRPINRTITNTPRSSIRKGASSSKSPPRILLGIFSNRESYKYGDKAELKRRRVLRTTYLNFDYVHDTDTPFRVCSLPDFLSKLQDTTHIWSKHECQLVYVFAMGETPPPRETKRTKKQKRKTEEHSNSLQAGVEIDGSSQNKTSPPSTSREADAIYFNILEKPTETAEDQLNKTWAWFQYCCSNTDATSTFSKESFTASNHKKETLPPLWQLDVTKMFDYVAHTDTQVLLFPTKFWEENSIFSHDHSRPIQQVYAGIPQSQHGCSIHGNDQDDECISLPMIRNDDGSVMDRFVLLSTNLARYLSTISVQQMLSRKKSEQEANVVVANELDRYANEQSIALDRIPLQGLMPVMMTASEFNRPERRAGRLVEIWDAYKDPLVDYNKTNQKYMLGEDIMKSLSIDDTSQEQQQHGLRRRRRPKLVIGIFTMDSPEETERRQMIRDTYLSFFRPDTGNMKRDDDEENVENGNEKHEEDDDDDAIIVGPDANRICSLHELLRQQLQQRHANNRNDTMTSAYGSLWDECQMAYTFVMGANPDGPKELVHLNETFPTITVPHPSSSILPYTTEYELNPETTDMVFLNIQENMKEGKSQSWLKYVTQMMEQSKLAFDYIGKIDGDNVLYPKLYLDNVIDKLPLLPYNQRTFVGEYRIKDKVKITIGPVYMGGHLYVMSPDLAYYIISDDCPRSKLAVYSEDQSIGNFIHSHPNKAIRRIIVPWNILYQHPIKLCKMARQVWKEHTKKMDKMGKSTKVIV